MYQYIEIEGAKEHNLKDISIKIPKNKLVVLTGPSGSGKSTLAMDILQRECQRQYMESMGLVTDGISKTKVDKIIGLSPSIGISQTITNRNPRSTVGTTTEIFTYLRILYTKVGERLCPNCNNTIKPGFEDAIEIEDEYEDYDESIESNEYDKRDFIECAECHYKLPKLTMAHFSFNKPEGFCPTCSGLGVVNKLDLTPILNRDLTIKEGAVIIWGELFSEHYSKVLEKAAKYYGFDFDTSKAIKNYNEFEELVFYYGVESEEFKKLYPSKKPPKTVNNGKYEGLITFMNKKAKESIQKGISNKKIEECFKLKQCKDCGGTRLNENSRLVKLNNRSIVEVAKYTVNDLLKWLIDMEKNLSNESLKVGKPVVIDIKKRVKALVNIGLEYLSIDRPMTTLSGGEVQRLRLASLVDSGLTGVLYVLDEPSVGLHPKDVNKLVGSLKRLRDIGNTVLVIEHDTDFIKEADYIIDFGPGSGIQGGQIVSKGTVEEIKKDKNSITGEYLTNKQIELSRSSEIGNDKIQIMNTFEHNLKNISVDIPLNGLVCLTGVSGSGKSSLAVDVLYHWIKMGEAKCEKILGLEKISKAIFVSQSSIGRVSRSNVATYTDIYTPIREIFSRLDGSKKRKLNKKHFSFNVKGGRCEKCLGLGIINLDMHFLPNAEVTCPVCKGKRFKEKVLEVKYKGYTILDILNMSVDENIEIFDTEPSINSRLKVLKEVGLGYLKLGQSTSTLSGGESQRIKLSKELGRKNSGNTLYLLDEPTTGLHPRDVYKLIKLLKRLVEEGNTVLVIEHSLEIIAQADWIIDLGPEGGSHGGRVVFEGAPYEIINSSDSYTGKYLKRFTGKKR